STCTEDGETDREHLEFLEHFSVDCVREEEKKHLRLIVQTKIQTDLVLNWFWTFQQLHVSSCVSSGSCPGGWKKFGCRCYFLSPTQSSWSTSRQQCSNQGAELVVIRSQEEMVFLNKLGDRLKFWIGLKQTFGSFNWEWTDGRSPATTFEEGNFRGTFLSWSRELCSQNLQWVCEKPAEYV
uniref:C-type lectin domain-containing protein n=1 Tax=Stegastes partitus TaxID=144197 RepID=A0A3B4Z9H1_9TELE